MPKAEMDAVLRELESLRARVKELESSSTANDDMASEAEVAAVAKRFTPLRPRACLMQPCLNSTATERLAAGCARRIWSGAWALDETAWIDRSTRRARMGVGMGDQLWWTQRFQSSALDCQAAEALVLSPQYEANARHVSVATSQFTLQRLGALRGALWLMLGTSIDHGIVHEVCVHWKQGAPKVYDAPPTALFPRPGMHVVYCRLPAPLDFTMAQVTMKGLTSEAHARDRALHERLLSEVGAALAHLGFPHGPQFMSYSGAEWDFSNFGRQGYFPSARADWLAIRRSIEMQIGVARATWPRLHGLFLRTQSPTRYRWARDRPIANDSAFERYAHVERLVVAADRNARSQSQSCGALATLDLAAMLNCTTEGAPPARRNCHEWTRDWLHPWPFVYGAYFNIAANVLADVGEACTRSRAENG